ncbi:tetratricopeptide repeat protein [Desulfosoma caldarium]|uniref:Tetratricopeptide repeat protein n=1 Tax=Desulfosoma caldarium TaxID=610254 RepID=A0A3N1VKD4_9BACT|nr:tetratricopeptide repeat protein [Desulfosoma caldarium]ROR03265.1 tetratricopeptide repeat protein [Desulfosoma caldarium]
MRLVTGIIAAMLVLSSGLSAGHAMQTATDLVERARKDTIMYRRAALYTEALALDAGLVEALRERGTIYYYQGKLDEAEADLTAYMEKGGRDVRGLLFRALVFMKRQQWEKALADLQGADAWDEKRSDGLSYRAEVFYELGRVAEAERDVAAVLSLHDDSTAMARALLVRGRIEADRGNSLAAREAYRQAASVDPTVGLLGTWASVFSPEQVSRIGFWALLVLPALLIFRIALPKPVRRNRRP